MVYAQALNYGSGYAKSHQWRFVFVLFLFKWKEKELFWTTYAKSITKAVSSRYDWFSFKFFAVLNKFRYPNVLQIAQPWEDETEIWSKSSMRLRQCRSFSTAYQQNQVVCLRNICTYKKHISLNILGDENYCHQLSKGISKNIFSNHFSEISLNVVPWDSINP